MRLYRDLELVEQLGSGVLRILDSYGKECFYFMHNFIRMTFPDKVTSPSKATEQVQNLLSATNQNEQSAFPLMGLVGIKYRPTFLYNYLQPALEMDLIAMTKPEKPIRV